MASPFDHVNAIYTDQSLTYFDNLDEKEKKAFSTYMVNRIISMNPDYISLVNEFQQYSEVVTGRETYLFYSQIIPQRKQYHKYIKGNKESKYEEWLIDLVKKHYQLNHSDTLYYLSILYQTDEGKENLRDICAKYGIDPKKFKKAKL